MRISLALFMLNINITTTLVKIVDKFTKSRKKSFFMESFGAGFLDSFSVADANLGLRD